MVLCVMLYLIAFKERFDVLVKWCEESGKEVVRLKRTPGVCSSDIKKNFKMR